MRDLANALPRWKGTCGRQWSGLGDWGNAGAVSRGNRKNAPNLKGAENEMSLTLIVLICCLWIQRHFFNELRVFPREFNQKTAIAGD